MKDMVCISLVEQEDDPNVRHIEEVYKDDELMRSFMIMKYRWEKKSFTESLENDAIWKEVVSD